MFSNPAAVLRLAGAVLVGQHDGWEPANAATSQCHARRSYPVTGGLWNDMFLQLARQYKAQFVPQVHRARSSASEPSTNQAGSLNARSIASMCQGRERNPFAGGQEDFRDVDSVVFGALAVAVEHPSHRIAGHVFQAGIDAKL